MFLLYLMYRYLEIQFLKRDTPQQFTLDTQSMRRLEFHFSLIKKSLIKVKLPSRYLVRDHLRYVRINDSQKLFTLVKVAYAMLIITLLLMMWASVARMYELPVQYPPCFFNPLCTCSKAIPDLGIVACYNVPMPRIPQTINSSKVFMLQLENNGLRFLQSQYLMNTGTLAREKNTNFNGTIMRSTCTIVPNSNSSS